MTKKADAPATTEIAPAELLDASFVTDGPQALSFESLVAGGELVNPAAVLGGDAKIINDTDKDSLIGEAFIILDYAFREQGTAGPFVSVNAITAHNERVIINDGSTGIYRQCKELEAAGLYENIAVRKGLRRSDFQYDPESRRTVKPSDPPEVKARAKAAHTYYLDTSR